MAVEPFGSRTVTGVVPCGCGGCAPPRPPKPIPQQQMSNTFCICAGTLPAQGTDVTRPHATITGLAYRIEGACQAGLHTQRHDGRSASAVDERRAPRRQRKRRGARQRRQQHRAEARQLPCQGAHTKQLGVGQLQLRLYAWSQAPREIFLQHVPDYCHVQLWRAKSNCPSAATKHIAGRQPCGWLTMATDAWPGLIGRLSRDSAEFAVSSTSAERSRHSSPAWRSSSPTATTTVVASRGSWAWPACWRVALCPVDAPGLGTPIPASALANDVAS